MHSEVSPAADYYLWFNKDNINEDVRPLQGHSHSVDENEGAVVEHQPIMEHALSPESRCQR